MKIHAQALDVVAFARVDADRVEILVVVRADEVLDLEAARLAGRFDSRRSGEPRFDVPLVRQQLPARRIGIAVQFEAGRQVRGVFELDEHRAAAHGEIRITDVSEMRVRRVREKGRGEKRKQADARAQKNTLFRAARPRASCSLIAAFTSSTLS